MKITRRQALRRALTATATATATAGALAIPRLDLRSAEKLPDLRPKDGFRIGACDWSLGRAGDPSALEYAKQLGLHGIQASFGAPGERFDLRKRENRERYFAESKKHGTVVASLGMGLLNNHPYKSDPRTEEWVHDSIAVAQAMKTNVVLLAFFGKNDLKGDKKGTAEVIRRLKRVAPIAEKAGVIFGLETWLDKREHLHIIDDVGSSSVQVYYDVGNSLHRGYDIYREMRELGKDQICELHAKDYASKLFGHGDVDFWETRRALDEIGFRGWIQIEGRTPFGRTQSYRHDAMFLRSLFPPNAPVRSR